MPGPPPKPARLRVLSGNPSKRPLHPEPEPELATGLSPPAFLTTEGLTEWDRLVPELESLKLLAAIDAGMIAGLCQSWSTFVRCSEILNGDDAPDVGSMDWRRLHATANESHRHYLRLGSEFGLSPSARGRLSVEPEDSPGNKMRKWLREH